MPIRGSKIDGHERKVEPPTPIAKATDREPDRQTTVPDARPEFIAQTHRQIFELLLRESYDTHPEARERFAKRDDAEFTVLQTSPELGREQKEMLVLMRLSHENARKALALREKILSGATDDEPGPSE